jgi:hypothetical protein
MFEKFDLAEAFLRGFQSFVGPAKVFALAGNHLIPTLYFDDHGDSPCLVLMGLRN